MKINKNDSYDLQMINEEGEIHLDKNIEKITWENQGLILVKNIEERFSFSPNEKLILRTLHRTNSIPKQYHKEIWYILSGAKQQLITNENYYNNIVNNYPKFIPSPFENQIELDIPRTYPNEKFFTKDNLQKLKNILTAYTRRNVTIGYCQGFNFLVGKLLEIYDDEEKVFWIFVQILEEILPINYYNCLYGVMIDAQIITELIEMQASTSENTQNIYFQQKILVYLINLFSNSVNMEALYAIYDLFFLEGTLGLFHIIRYLSGFIRTNNKFLKNVGINLDLGEMNIYNDDIIYKLEGNEIIKLREEIFNEQGFEFSENTINRIRKNFAQDIMIGIRDNFKYKEIMEKENNLMRNTFLNKIDYCDVDWPLCIYDRKYRYEINDFIVYKTFGKIDIKEEYFYTDFSDFVIIENKKKGEGLDEVTKKIKIYEGLLIERRKHLCINKGNENGFRNKIKNNNCKEQHEDLNLKLEKELINLKENTSWCDLDFLNNINDNYLRLSQSIIDNSSKNKKNKGENLEKIFEEINCKLDLANSILFNK